MITRRANPNSHGLLLIDAQIAAVRPEYDLTLRPADFKFIDGLKLLKSSFETKLSLLLDRGLTGNGRELATWFLFVIRSSLRI